MVATLRSLCLRMLAVFCMLALLAVVQSAPLDEMEAFDRDVRAPKAKFIRFGRAGQKFIRFGRGGAYGPETSFQAGFYPADF